MRGEGEKMTEIPEKQNDSVAALPSAGNMVGDLRPATAVPTNNRTMAAPQSTELIRDPCSLKIAPAKAADPFFSGRKHFPELDGLRGLAILLVLFCHYAFILPVRGRFGASLEILSFQGWMGVTLFFVLSGFLITRILYDAKGQAHYFRNFYARRTLRIFPLYYGILGLQLLVLLIIKFGFPHAWLHLHNPRKLWGAMPWLSTYTTNIGQSFFHINSVIEGHFWSLAVEEQFYLVWPLLVFILPWRGLVKACAALVVTAFLVRAALAADANSFAAYSLTPCQFDALGLGALAALLVRDPSRYALLKEYAVRALVVGGLLLAVILVSAVALKLNPTLLGSHSVRLADGGSDARGIRFNFLPWLSVLVYAPLDLACAAVLAAVVTGASPSLQRIFGFRPLRKLGKYSYGLYVFHFIVFMMLGNLLIHFPRIEKATTNHTLPAIGLLSANLAISLALAYASYHLYEKHFLKLKKYFPERTATGQ